MKRVTIAIICVFFVMTTCVQAQEQTRKRPTTYEEFIVSVWKAVHNKLLDMAKDLPEDKYGWRPHPDSRSMLEELRHVVLGLEMSAAQLRGENFDYTARLKADEQKPATRESILGDMEAAIAVSYPLVEKNPKPNLIWWVEHQGEHYGKMVSDYRMNNMVPPVSRQQ